MRHIKGMLSDIKGFFASLTAKKIIFGIIILVLLAVPTVLAGYYVLQEEIFVSEDMFSVTLYSSGEKLLASEEKDTESAPKNSLTYVFHTLSGSSVTTGKDQPLTDGKNYVRAEYTYKGITRSINCYFSADSEKSGYYTDESGNKFIIPNDINTIFMSLPQSEVFYSNSTPYSLMTIDGDKIIPQQVTWMYRTLNGEYRELVSAVTTKELLVYDITGAIDFSFSVAPDKYMVNVYGADGLIYEGSGKGLSSLPIDHEGILRVTVDAEWGQSDNTDRYGRVLYEFGVNIKNRSVFTLSTSSIRKGGFVILDLSNVNDISKLSCISSDESVMPDFKWYNGALRAVIHFPEDIKADSVSFDISYGASGDHLTVDLLTPTPSIHTPQNYGFTDSISASRYFTGVKSSVVSNYPSSSEQVYFRGNFLSPESMGFTAIFSHGDTLVLNGDIHQVIAYGNEYSAAADTSVKALQNGVVAKIAYDEYIGNYVVIDHGCGLMTYYANLGSVDVSFGDILLAGQHIGSCGENLFGRYGFTLYCAANGNTVAPQALWEQ